MWVWALVAGWGNPAAGAVRKVPQVGVAVKLGTLWDAARLLQSLWDFSIISLRFCAAFTARLLDYGRV